MQINPLTELYNDFVNIIKNSVIKYKSVADDNETLECKRNADAYVRAYYAQDTFNTYYSFDEDVLREYINNMASKSDSEKIELFHLWSTNKSKIDIVYRDDIVKLQRKYIIDNYEEANNYYRYLNGLPDYNDKNAIIYISELICNKFNITTGTAIHELTNEQLSIITSDSDGSEYINNIIESNPTKKYLKYLGSNKIDIPTARLGLNFSLLRIPQDINTSTWSSFAYIYDQCREYFTNVIYIPEYKQTMDYYDNFIALCIMVMTFQQMTARVIKSTIERDFFDDYCIKLLFTTYGVPYDSDVNTSTLRQIAQNLNILIQNKGSNQVIYNIASLLGYDYLDLYKYYLVKRRKFDSNGLPVVSNKTDSLEAAKDMYDINFQRVYYDDTDTYTALVNDSNSVDYEEITDPDPFWYGDDDELLKELYLSEYNYVESKYMGVSITYKLTRILFDNIYFIQMIFDHNIEASNIPIGFSPLGSDYSIDLFTAIISLCSLVCKYNGLNGEIIGNVSGSLYIGFNYDNSELNNQLTKVREIYIQHHMDDNDFNEITDSFIIELDKLILIYKSDRKYTADDINSLSTYTYDMYETLVDIMSTTNDINVYRQARALYESLYFTSVNRDIFTNHNTGETYSTYLEYLQTINSDIYDLIQSSSKTDLYYYIDILCNNIKKIITANQYFGYQSGSVSALENTLLGLIDFFKSYTTDMVGLEVIMIFDMKYDTLFRFIDRIEKTHKSLSASDDIHLSYNDHITYTSTVNLDETMGIVDKLKKFKSILHLDDNMINDKLIRLLDIISIKYKSQGYDDGMLLYDKILMTCISLLECDVSINDKIDLINTFLQVCDNTILSGDEEISISSSSILNDNMSIIDKLSLIVSIILNDNKISLTDKISYIMKYLLLEDLPVTELRDKCYYILSHIDMEESFYAVDAISKITSRQGQNDSLFLKDYYYIKSE